MRNGSDSDDDIIKAIGALGCITILAVCFVVFGLATIWKVWHHG